MRDISISPVRRRCRDFAADAGRARLAIGHHAVRRRHDGDAEAVHHARNVVLALVDAQAGLRDALDLLDDRPPGVVAQRDLELRLARFLAGNLEAFDVALVLQHLGDRDLDLRRRASRRPPLRHLRVADARQHVGDGISHAHASPRSYQLALTMPGISPRIAYSRSLLRPRPNLLYTPRGRPVMRAAVAQARRVGVARQRLQLEPRRVAVLVRHPRVRRRSLRAPRASSRTSRRASRACIGG